MTTLVTLRPGLTLEAQAAASWARMEAERGAPLDVNRSTVSRAEQQEVYDDYLAYLAGGPWAPLALDPDDSWHCEPIARAVDTDDDEWIRAHPDHGWRFVVKSERWHAQHYPHLDLHRNEPSGGNARPFPTPRTNEEEYDMNGGLVTTEVVLGAGDSQGIQRWWVTFPTETTKGTRRKISSNEEATYKALGARAIAGLQPLTFVADLAEVQ